MRNICSRYRKTIEYNNGITYKLKFVEVFVREGAGRKGEGKGYLPVLRSVFFEALSSLI